MLERRILSKFLPENFDQLEQFISIDFCSSMISRSSTVNYRLKQLKIIQESKRSWLDIYLRACIWKIQEHDQHYQSEVVQLEQGLNNSGSRPETNLLPSLHLYMAQRCHRLKEEIYLQMTYFHATLRRRRQLSAVSKHMVGVSSQVMLDVHPRHHDLNDIECEYLSRGNMTLLLTQRSILRTNLLSFLFLGGNYIRPNRTILRPYSERKKLVQEQHDEIMKKIVEHLSTHCRSLRSTSPLFKQFSQRLHACLTLRYMTPLPRIDQLRAKQEREIVKSIRRKLKKGKLVLRQSDKGGNLYVGRKSLFEEKATAYRTSTGAYEELSTNPLEEILSKVTRLLNDLHMKTKVLSAKQYKRMIPTRKDVRLAYMYFNPKTHKVSTRINRSSFFSFFLLLT